MIMDRKDLIHARPICPIGGTQYDYHTLSDDTRFVRYDYCTQDGKLFSVIACNLDEAKAEMIALLRVNGQSQRCKEIVKR